MKKCFTLTRDTNGPYKVTVQKKTKDSLLLRNGLSRLIKNISFINLLFVDQVELLTLLSTQVEVLTSVTSNTPFSALNYARDIGTIVKQSLERITKWAAH